tara:strand:+ start:271 stop:672 length:402 start_codon:yes stop_codon:yes gene_type:complete
MARKLEPTIIKDVNVHSDFIPALQSMLMYYIDQVYPEASDLAKTLNTFQRMISGEIKEKDVKMEWYEYHAWILYSLIQLLSSKASEQGLYQDVDIEYDEDIIAKLSKAIIDKDTDTQKALYKDLFNDIKKKSS